MNGRDDQWLEAVLKRRNGQVRWVALTEKTRKERPAGTSRSIQEFLPDRGIKDGGWSSEMLQERKNEGGVDV